MKTVITYGTFDLFHVGHVRLLERLYSLGDKLIVGLSSDEFNLLKGKKSFYSYSERKEILLSCKFVSEVFPENNWEQKESDIIRYNADVFAMGDDWVGKFNQLSSICEVVYLPRTPEISTTEIKRSLSNLNMDELDKIEVMLHDVLGIIKSIA